MNASDRLRHGEVSSKEECLDLYIKALQFEQTIQGQIAPLPPDYSVDGVSSLSESITIANQMGKDYLEAKNAMWEALIDLWKSQGGETAELAEALENEEWDVFAV